MIDLILKSIFTHFECTIHNVAVRVLTREVKSLHDKVPTLLLRLKTVSLQKITDTDHAAEI